MTSPGERWDFRVGLAVGLGAGSTVAADTGVGIDMVLYAMLVLLCRADLKIAIPTSALIMAFTSVTGVAFKSMTTGLQPGVFENWLAAAPVVALGAFAVALIGRKPTLMFVAVLCVGQFIWTCHAERAALGVTGILLAVASVVVAIAGFEHLRRYGRMLSHLPADPPPRFIADLDSPHAKPDQSKISGDPLA